MRLLQNKTMRLLYKTGDTNSAAKVLQVQTIHRGTKRTVVDIQGRIRRKVRRKPQDKSKRRRERRILQYTEKRTQCGRIS